MENRLNRPNQPSGDDQPLSPELLQKQSITSTASAEQQLFQRITWLTLLLGLMIGIWLTFLAGLWYVSAGFIPHAFSPLSPIIYRLLGPLMMTSFGFVPILLGRVQPLRRQYSARPGRFDLLNSYPWPLNSLSAGLFLIWIGGSQVILLWFDPDHGMWGTVTIVGIVVLVVALLAEMFFLFLRNHHTAQQ